MNVFLNMYILTDAAKHQEIRMWPIMYTHLWKHAFACAWCVCVPLFKGETTYILRIQSKISTQIVNLSQSNCHFFWSQSITTTMASIIKAHAHAHTRTRARTPHIDMHMHMHAPHSHTRTQRSLACTVLLGWVQWKNLPRTRTYESTHIHTHAHTRTDTHRHAHTHMHTRTHTLTRPLTCTVFFGL